MTNPATTPPYHSNHRWYEEYLAILALIREVSLKHGKLAKKVAPMERRICDLERFIRFVALPWQRPDGSCSMCGEAAAPDGEPERHRKSYLIQQARDVLARAQ
jgi:hypothetical protein